MKNSNFTPYKPVEFIEQQTIITLKAIDTHDMFTHAQIISNKAEALIQWNTPPVGRVKLNLDGASRGNPGPAGCGGVFREHLGKWLAGFSVNLGVCTSIKAEMMALRHGLKIARDKGFRKVIIHMDSKLIVDKMKNHALRNQAHYFALKDCRALVNDNSLDYRLLHCYRESNQTADALANLGVTQAEKLILYTSLPPSMYVILREDFVRVAWACIVINQ